MVKMEQTKIKDFESFVDKVMESYGAQGVAVSIFGKNETYYENFFGFRDSEEQIKIDENTIFGMASISKSFTCLAVMQLVEKGIVDLDGLVSDYIPAFSGKNQKGVRLRHLLSHAAGFFPEKRILVKDIAQQIGIWDNRQTHDITYNEKLAAEGIKLVAGRLDSRTKHIGKPGELMSYSNDSYGLIADIIGRYGGEGTYSAYVKKHILEPLEMSRSSLEFEAPAKDPNCTQLYIYRNGKLEACKDFYDNAFVLMGGGAMKSSVGDLKKYTRMYLNEGVGSNGKTLLSQYYTREMVKPRQFYRFQQYYGFGLSTKFMDDINVIGHGGSLTGVSNMFQWSPQLECGIIVFCNTSDFPAGVIADAAMRLANNKKIISKRDLFRDTPWSDETLKAACGLYKSDEGAVYEITCENGAPVVKVNNEALDIRTVSNDMLLINRPYNKADLILCRNNNGEVWGIRTGGRIIPKADN